MVDSTAWNFYDNVKSPDSACWLLGPVVGLVTPSVARVLVEGGGKAGGEVAFQTSLAGEEGKVVSSGKAPLQAGKPALVVLDGLQEGNKYVTKFTMGGEERTAAFSTPSPKSQWKVAVVSCNNHQFHNKTGLWERLSAVSTRGELDFCLHLGDQVYCDDDYKGKGVRNVVGNFLRHGHFVSSAKTSVVATHPDENALDSALAANHEVEAGASTPSNRTHSSAWVSCHKLLEKIAPEEWEGHFEKLVDIYRITYRQTWNYGPTAALLASCSNCMIIDDHEIVDNLGDKEEHYDRESANFIVEKAGYCAYLEYQACLTREIDTRNALVPAFYSLKITDKIGVFMTDNRIERSLRRHVHADKDWTDKHFMGPEQWEALQTAFYKDFKHCDVVLLGTPTPAVLMGSRLTSLAAKEVSDAIGTWGNLEFAKEQLDLVSLLSGWQGAKPNRAAIILGGDIHVGGFTEASMRRSGTRSIINELTASAVGNYPTRDVSGIKKLILKGLLNADASLDFDFDVRHQEWEFAPNFGILDIVSEKHGHSPLPFIFAMARG
jgi:phosphodiesterase/alkaline phosphatase D-like protein